MRIDCSDEEDFPGQFDLWQGNCRRSLQGKAGQAALRELEAALLALPDKRLIANDLINGEGEVCAIGALAKQKGAINGRLVSLGEYDMEEVGVLLGMPRLVAWKVVYENDKGIDFEYETLPGPYRWPMERPQIRVDVTPEIRYEKMLAWVREQINSDAREMIAP